ncbi:hypothetical protein NPIL_249261 [Nephila pilipes]|uniref:Uncharacterized protein n=1 Tax=Nephila pilipes TaxID=299642 RepID=A0A8X6NBB1_NEPPI|nr:hypothetical protein NPIL_249261 [Nephila pilipes]
MLLLILPSVPSSRYFEPSSAARHSCFNRTKVFSLHAKPHIAPGCFRPNSGSSDNFEAFFNSLVSSSQSPCDLWLRAFLKDLVYGGNIRALPEMKASITRLVDAIDREILRAITEHTDMN